MGNPHPVMHPQGGIPRQAPYSPSIPTYLTLVHSDATCLSRSGNGRDQTQDALDTTLACQPQAGSPWSFTGGQKSNFGSSVPDDITKPE